MLYVTQRAGQANRVKFSTALQQTWNRKLGSNKVVRVDIVNEDEVFDLKRYMNSLLWF